MITYSKKYLAFDIDNQFSLPISFALPFIFVNAKQKMSIFAEIECHFSAVSIAVYTALIHHFTCRLEACQALIYQLVLGLTGENGKYNYSIAVHVYPPFFDIPCSAKNYKIAPALTVIRPCSDEPDRWQSALWKIDQTYMAPRYYMKTDSGRFAMAQYVDVDRPQDLEKSVRAGCTVPPQEEGVSIVPKKSVREQLRKAEREIGQRPTSKEHSKGGEAR